MESQNKNLVTASLDLTYLKHDAISLQQLEFEKIITALSERISTPYGYEKLATLNFYRKIENVRISLSQVSEMQSLVEGGYRPSMSGFSNILPLLDKIKPRDAFLESKELLDIKRNLESFGEIRLFFSKYQDVAPLLWRFGERLTYHKTIVKSIDQKIERNGDIVDHASPELRKIRIKIRSLESEQKKTMGRMQKKYEEFLQDGIVTLRDGRQVLGIVPSLVNRVNGIVHGTSGSGATIFVEPMETLRISNEIQTLLVKERTEIIKILRLLTAEIREVRDNLYYCIENLAILDVILAKALLAVSLEGQMPKLSTTPKIFIKEGRHPLLSLKSGLENVEALTIQLGKSFNTLVITGPNAGGKTVSMKTVGLLLLMTQMGIPIPAHSESEIPIMRKILVDIGDRQSLENDLSTFSAHIVRLKHVLKEANEESLVLLDEVGTGTDPKEGSALAISILKELTSKGALTIATTHHGELKAYAHESESVENASMEFDLATLAPTYRLRVGIPGSSYAIEIARRYGLGESLIENARKYIGEEKDRLEDLILSLEDRLQQAEKERREANIKLTKAEAMQTLYAHQLEEYKKRKTLRKQEVEIEAQKVLQDANALIEKVVRDIKENSAEKTVIKQAKKLISERKQLLEKSLQPGLKHSKIIEPLEKGDLVWVDSLNDTGELLEDVKGRKKVRVLIGNVTLTLSPNGIRRSNKPAKSKKIESRLKGKDVDSVSSERTLPELDLRGLDSHDAIDETDRYLSRAIEDGWEEVRIVHGKGTGVLRKVINNYLAKDKRISEKRLGTWGEGDTGVTIAKLRYA